VKNLLGCEGQSFLLFGMLACLKQGEWYLEDLDADVKLDFQDLEGKVRFPLVCF
jgi:hypothetical protein